MKNILVALEFDSKAEKLLKKAEEYALTFDAHVWIVHMAAPDPGFVGYEVGPELVRNARAETLMEERRTLQAHAKRMNRKGIKSTGLVIEGATVEGIIEEVDKVNADLLMIGFNAHGPLYNLFIGGTTTSVIEQCPVPMLVIP